MTAGILSERRSVPPFGLFGGASGEKGLNLLIRSSGRVVNLGGKATVQLQAGDVLRISTPGAGGFGAAAAAADAASIPNGTAQGKPRGTSLATYDVVGSVDTYRRLQETA
jgi:5-oxoprolinase (ATP-hydrolysing)